MTHEFGWSFADWKRLGQATLVGHVLGTEIMKWADIVKAAGIQPE